MKKTLLVALLLISTTVMAEHFHGVRCRCNQPGTTAPFKPLSAIWDFILSIRIY